MVYFQKKFLKQENHNMNILIELISFFAFIYSAYMARKAKNENDKMNMIFYLAHEIVFLIFFENVL